MALLMWARAPPDDSCAYWAVLLAAALVPADSFEKGKAYWPLRKPDSVRKTALCKLMRDDRKYVVGFTIEQRELMRDEPGLTTELAPGRRATGAGAWHLYREWLRRRFAAADVPPGLDRAQRVAGAVCHRPRCGACSRIHVSLSVAPSGPGRAGAGVSARIAAPRVLAPGVAACGGAACRHRPCSSGSLGQT